MLLGITHRKSLHVSETYFSLHTQSFSFHNWNLGLQTCSYRRPTVFQMCTSLGSLAHIYTYSHTQTHSTHAYTPIHKHTHTYIHTYSIQTYTRAHWHTHKYTYTQIHSYTDTLTYTFTYTYLTQTYTHIHTHTVTHTQRHSDTCTYTVSQLTLPRITLATVLRAWYRENHFLTSSKWQGGAIHIP